MSPARRVAGQLALEWARADQARQEALADAIATHSAMPANYWREEYVARMKLIAAVAIADVLEEGEPT